MLNGYHQPVLVAPAVRLLLTRREGVYVDCTLGGGGHSRAILEELAPEGLLVGLDADPEALATARETLSGFDNAVLKHVFFDQIEIALVETGRLPVDGVLYDLGVSSHQLDAARRGFTFRTDAPLDMRFDPRQKRTAAHILNAASEEELGQLLREYGEERHWRAVAREIVARRAASPLAVSGDLVAIVRAIVGERHLNKSLARVFQALRIEVNQELERLRRSLDSAFTLLREGGRLVVISYHSLEDRIVKNFFREKERDCICPPELPVCACDKEAEMRILTRRPVTPDDVEISRNARARSARLRAAEKTVPWRGAEA